MSKDLAYVCYTRRHIITALHHIDSHAARFGAASYSIIVVKNSLHINFESYFSLKKYFDHIDFLYVDVSLCGRLRKIFLGTIGAFSMRVARFFISKRLNFVLGKIRRSDDVYIFHDKPLVSTLLLSERTAHLIEEGASNYRCYSKLAMILYSVLGHMFSVYLPLGRHPKVTDIYLSRSCRCADIANKVRGLTIEPNKALEKRIFRCLFDTQKFPFGAHGFSLLVLQNFSVAGFSQADVSQILRLFSDVCSDHFSKVYFKPHPNDPFEYELPDRNLFELPREVPLELIEEHVVSPKVAAFSFVGSSLFALGNKISWNIVFPGKDMVEELRGMELRALLDAFNIAMKKVIP